MRGAKSGRSTLVLILIGCAAGQRVPEVKPALDYSGIYRMSQTDQPVACSPQPLPEALSQDTSIGFPKRVTKMEPFLARVQHDGSRVSITPLDLDQKELGESFTGTIDDNGRFSVTRKLPAENTSTASGNRFSLEQQTKGAGRFQLVREVARMAGSGEFRYLIRKGPPSDPVFTTCTVAISFSGNRHSR